MVGPVDSPADLEGAEPQTVETLPGGLGLEPTAEVSAELLGASSASGTPSGTPSTEQEALGSLSLGSAGEDEADAHTPEPFSAPMQVPGYELIQPIAYGGMAEVYLAERAGSAGVPVRCVLKTILPEHRGTEKYRERFLDEARIVAELRHPNIASIIDVGQVGEGLWLAMEWVDGVDSSALMRRLRRRKLEIPLRHALYILRESLQGLHHAHTARGADGSSLEIVHRDISPGNILLSKDGAVKLTDFGVAQGVRAQRVERRGTLAGKIHYFAPELFTGERRATPQTDLFALGVSFYEMLTIRPLVSRKLSVKEVRAAIMAFDPATLFEEDLTVPDELETILRRALAPEVSDRYVSALEFLEDVNDYAYESGLRLLGPHFAKWLERVLAPRRGDGRRSLLSGSSEEVKE